MRATIIFPIVAAMALIAALSYVLTIPTRSVTVQVMGNVAEFKAMLASSPKQLQGFQISQNPASGWWMFSATAASEPLVDQKIEELKTFLDEWCIEVTGTRWIKPVETSDSIHGNWRRIRIQYAEGYEHYR